MSHSEQRPENTGRHASKGGSAIAALFRNVLRGSFPQDTADKRAPDTARTEHPVDGDAKEPPATALDQHDKAAAAHGIDIAQSSVSAGELQRLQESTEELRIGEEPASCTPPLDAELLVLKFASLADRDSPFDARLEALRGVAGEIRVKKLVNVGALWHAISDIAQLAFMEPVDAADAHALDPELRLEARVLVLGVLAELAKGKLPDKSLGTGAVHMRKEMLEIVGMAKGWAEVSLATQSASWASDNALHLTSEPTTWSQRACQWVKLAAAHCYSEDMLSDVLDVAPTEASSALTASIEFLSQIVRAEYPVLDPEEILAVTASLCAKAVQVRPIDNAGVEEVVWIWREPAHLYATLQLLSTVTTYGALSKDVMHPAIMLLCTTVSIASCRKLCCEIVGVLFTSCYMRDTLLAMNYIVRKGNTGLNSLCIFGADSMSPHQAAVNGMVYFITQVMDTGQTALQFGLRTGNCLPVLAKAAESKHADVLRLVYPYVCKIASDTHVETMLPEDWDTLVYIMERTSDYRLQDGGNIKDSDGSKATEADGVFNGDEDVNSDGNGDFNNGVAKEERALMNQLYDDAVAEVVYAFNRIKMQPPKCLVDLLYLLREVLSDEIAQLMLHFIDGDGVLRANETHPLIVLECLMHIYYFDRSRSLPLRRQVVRMLAKCFAESAETSDDIASIPFVISMLEMLHIEEDQEIVESVLEILELSLKKPENAEVLATMLNHVTQAAIEPLYVRQIQQQPPQHPHQYQQHSAPHSSSNTNAGDISPRQLTTSMSSPVLVDSGASDINEKSYSSYTRISCIVKWLLKLFERRIKSSAVSDPVSYSQDGSSIIELTERLLDLLESAHSFPSTQREILGVFLRLHADSTNKLYVLQTGSDTVLDQRLSHYENTRVRLVTNTAAATRRDSESSMFGAIEAEDTGNPSSPTAASAEEIQFPIQRYLTILINILHTSTDIETYHILCRGLSVQLGNTYLFSNCNEQLHTLVVHLITFIRVVLYGQDARTRMSAADKNRMSALTYDLLVGAMHYKGLLRREHEDALIFAFSEGLVVTSSAFVTPQICLHALCVVMLELPGAMVRNLPGILQQLSRIYSAAQITVHLLEFISSVSREPRLYSNFHTQDYMMLFVVAINYIRFHNNQRRRETALPAGGNVPFIGGGGSGGGSGGGTGSGDPRRLSGSGSGDGHPTSPGAQTRARVKDVALNQYVFIMAYQVIDVYYLSLQPTFKAEIVDSLIMGLLQSNYSRTGLDEANAVCLDMILQNYNHSSEDVLALPSVLTIDDLGPVIERSWLQHNAIVTIRAQKAGPMAQIIVRSSSGTTTRLVDLPSEVRKKHAERAEAPVQSPLVSPATESPVSSVGTASGQVLTRARSMSRSRRPHLMGMPGQMMSMPTEANVLPLDSVKRLLLGELLPSSYMSRMAHLPINFGPAPCLAQEFITAYQGLQNIDPPEMLPPRSEAVARSIRVFDNTTTVDTHKVSVAYVGPGQTMEREILLNQQGSPAYWNFLRGLGNITRLSGMRGFSANLDTSGQDSDGRYTIRWRDLIAQLVFHVGTLMPAHKDKHEQIIRKKAHMGNDYVQIVFNESGRSYDFDTIPSQFNYVQIIVTPVDGKIPQHSDAGSWSRSESKNEKIYYDQLYKVKTQVNPNVPFYGPAMEPKLLTLSALPAFVRSVAIHAAILSQVFSSCQKAETSAAEFISPWRARLRTIQRIRLYAQRESAKSAPPPSNNNSNRHHHTSPQASDVSHLSTGSHDNEALEEFGEIVDDPELATTAAEALGYLVKDLNTFYNRT
ncbi:Tuberous sclerosis 2-like protein [Coemansia sp. Benny D115]|nr:Tuberous sclerosis 2-like protein [Coemansia sp. Benny D115]